MSTRTVHRIASAMSALSASLDALMIRAAQMDNFARDFGAHLRVRATWSVPKASPAHLMVAVGSLVAARPARIAPWRRPIATVSN